MPNSKIDPRLQSEPASESVFKTQPMPKRQTKQALLLELICREEGATLKELTSATTWLPHPARAAFTGLRKRGHDVSCTRVDGVSRYVTGSAR